LEVAAAIPARAADTCDQEERSMQTHCKVSTSFLTSQNAHRVGVLIGVEGERPVQRAPINVALVLDRSGSMHGEPLYAACEAAVRFTRFLTAEDWLSVVAFDDRIETIYGPAPAGDPAVENAIRRLAAGRTTNLSGGWLKGREHVLARLGEGVNRIVLLTDGRANEGITKADQLSGLAGGALYDGISTTCIGFGAHFNEDLLTDMAGLGGGNYWYVERHDQMGGIFDEEIEGLVALAAQNLEVEVAVDDPHVTGVSFPQGYPVQQIGERGYRLLLGDLYATAPRQLGVVFLVEDLEELGETRLGEVKLTADHLVSAGIEHRVTTLPVMANLDGADHVEPEVERTLLRFAAAKAREEAVEHADVGAYDEAAAVLREAQQDLAGHKDDPVVAEEMEDLAAEADRMAAHSYDASDRKYHLARGHNVRESRPGYIDKLSRRKRKRRG
jgi:Ca-activated chloride channel family protein